MPTLESVLSSTNVTASGASVARSLASRFAERISGDDFEIDKTGVADSVAAIQAAVASMPSGGRLVLRKGIYRFDVTGDTKSIQLPSDFHLYMEEGVILRWNNVGSPLLVISEKENISIEGGMFEWNGTMTNVTGSNPGRFSWTGATSGQREFCAHIMSMGSSGVRIRHSGCRRQGDNPTLGNQALLSFASIYPKDDNVTNTKDNAVEHCRIDDVIMGVLFVGQNNLSVKDIVSRRHPGDHPVTDGGSYLNGINGHIVYGSEAQSMVSRGCEFKDIIDYGQYFGAIAAQRNDVTVQLKGHVGSQVSGLYSKRALGMLSLFNFQSGSVSDSTWHPDDILFAAYGFYSALGVANGLKNNKLEMSFVLPDGDEGRAMNVGDASGNVIDAFISAAYPSAASYATSYNNSTDNRIRLDYLARNATTALAAYFNTGATRNIVEINPQGDMASAAAPYAQQAAGVTGNTVRIKGEAASKWSSVPSIANEADNPFYGIEGLRKSRVARIGTTTNPTTTFTLPRPGVWVGTCQLMEGPGNGAYVRGGLYRIVWDTGTLQSVELLGTEWTKHANAPSAMTLTVSNAGVVTVTSTAATSTGWDIQYDFQSFGNNRYADF